MTAREQDAPDPAGGAQVRKDGGGRSFLSSCAIRRTVWQALTDPAHLREWAPFDAMGAEDGWTHGEARRWARPRRMYQGGTRVVDRRGVPDSRRARLHRRSH